jgi:hypothetical protein
VTDYRGEVEGGVRRHDERRGMRGVSHEAHDATNTERERGRRSVARDNRRNWADSDIGIESFVHPRIGENRVRRLSQCPSMHGVSPTLTVPSLLLGGEQGQSREVEVPTRSGA